MYVSCRNYTFGSMDMVVLVTQYAIHCSLPACKTKLGNQKAYAVVLVNATHTVFCMQQIR